MKNLSVLRTLPSGSRTMVHPFHITMEATEQFVLCREGDDYDVYVKFLALAAMRRDVIVVTYSVMSNHSHGVYLARTYYQAKAFGEEVKRVYSMYLQGKYGFRKVMLGQNVDVQTIDSVNYLRNALAYDTRNVIEIRENPDLYRWSAHRAMFRRGTVPDGLRPLASMTVRECQRMMHTNMNLKSSALSVNPQMELEPCSFCDSEYFESAFNGDQAFYYKTIGLVNMPEMRYRTSEASKLRRNDTDFLEVIDGISMRWFGRKIVDITEQQKARLLPYVYHSMRTTPGQLARCFGLSTALVVRLLGK